MSSTRWPTCRPPAYPSGSTTCRASASRAGTSRSLIEQKHVVGVTSNPSIFQAALSHADDYAEQLDDLAQRGASVDDAVREITTDDVRRACEVFRGVFTETGGVNGRVSLEVDPRNAHKTRRHRRRGRRPVEDGRPAQPDDQDPGRRPRASRRSRARSPRASASTSTLIFSVDRYRRRHGRLPRRHGAGQGQRPRPVHDGLGRLVLRLARGLRGRRAAGEDRHPTRPWRCAGPPRSPTPGWPTRPTSTSSAPSAGPPCWAQARRPRRPLWASTGVKNNAYPDTLYVTELVAPDTVNTMPEGTLDAFADHGELHGDAVSGTAGAAAEVFAALSEVGIDVAGRLRGPRERGRPEVRRRLNALLETVSEQLTQRSSEQS